MGKTINHPPVITIFVGGILYHSQMGGLWLCFSHIMYIIDAHTHIYIHTYLVDLILKFYHHCNMLYITHTRGLREGQRGGRGRRGCRGGRGTAFKVAVGAPARLKVGRSIDSYIYIWYIYMIYIYMIYIYVLYI